HGRDLLVIVDLDGGGTAHADLAHLTGDERGVGGHPATSGEDAFGGDHAAEVFRRGFDADEEHLLPLVGGDDGAVGVEVDLAGGGAGTGGQAGGDDLGLLDLGEVEDRREQLLELVGRVAHDGGLPVDELLLHHIDGELQRGG